MKALIFGQPSQYSQRRDFQDLIGSFERYNFTVEQIDPESREGAGRMTTYDVTQLPAVVVVESGRGSVVAFWQGRLPSDQELNQLVKS